MEHVATTMQNLMEEDIKHRRLYLIQTYCIGKERLFLEVPIAAVSTPGAPAEHIAVANLVIPPCFC